MRESNQALVFKCSVATQENFIEMLTKSPRILHISCHGVDNICNSRQFFLQNQNPDHFEEENFLLFERMTGEGELVSARQLRTLVREALPDLDVVFVAACKSEFVGQIFLRCGARHVICV